MSETINAYDILDKVLKPKGFNYLTSESCAYSMRVLFDITPDAEELLVEFLGGNIEFNQSGWNSSNCHSVMITRAMIPDIAVFIMLHEWNHVVLFDNAKHGFHSFYRLYSSKEEYNQDLEEHTWLNDCIVRSWQGAKSSRNTHQFSGRLE